MLFARPLAVTSPLRLAASAAAVAVLATATAARMPVQPAEAAVIRPLTLGYDQDVYGDFLLAGNGNMRSPSTSADGTTLATCATAATRGKTTVNDNYDMQWADVDGVAATYNSSRAALTIPTGARVDFARLSWAGNTGQISGTTLVACGARQTQVGVAADLPPGGVTAQTNAVKLTVGSGTAASYTPGTSYVTDPGSGSDSSATYYSAFRDVTAQFSGVATGVAVPITVADVFTPEGFNCFAGWSLVLLYAFDDATTAAPLKRSVPIFNGHVRQLPNEAPTTTKVTGLRTATSDVRLGLTAYEGDYGLSGDALTVNGTAIPESTSGTAVTNNFFTSVAQGATTPSSPNDFSVDAKTVSTQALPAARTSASVASSTTGDSYRAQQLVGSAPVPDIRATKIRAPPPVRAGSPISFTITVSNPTPSVLNGVAVSDPQFPAATAPSATSRATARSAPPAPSRAERRLPEHRGLERHRRHQRDGQRHRHDAADRRHPAGDLAVQDRERGAVRRRRDRHLHHGHHQHRRRDAHRRRAVRPDHDQLPAHRREPGARRELDRDLHHHRARLRRQQQRDRHRHRPDRRAGHGVGHRPGPDRRLGQRPRLQRRRR